MTTAAPELCGHQWFARVRGHNIHRCDHPTDHPPTTPCRCRCGAATTRKDT